MKSFKSISHQRLTKQKSCSDTNLLEKEKKESEKEFECHKFVSSQSTQSQVSFDPKSETPGTSRWNPDLESLHAGCRILLHSVAIN